MSKLHKNKNITIDLLLLLLYFILYELLFGLFDLNKFFHLFYIFNLSRNNSSIVYHFLISSIATHFIR